jgi:membrane protease YdiL (CAAX protease family)
MTRQRAFTEAYRRDEHALPVNGRERVMMGFVAFVVGISEEMIFRGFLINYMAHTWGLPLLWSLTAGAAVFGLGHFSQGLAEVVSSAVFGLVMGFLFLYSGSLLWPIILHILYDLKIVVISKMLYKEKAEA